MNIGENGHSENVYCLLNHGKNEYNLDEDIPEVL